jgi:release factor glutamine methyltransferase
MAVLRDRTATPHSDASILLAHTLGRSREWLLAYGETPVPDTQAHAFSSLCEKRAAGMPIAYIIGFAGFYRREFAVSSDVLVPRPETETIVEDAIDYLRSNAHGDSSRRRPRYVFEAGVGSGAIACTIAAEVPSVIVEGTDTSPAALGLAHYNACRLNVQTRCTFTLADVARPGIRAKYDVVVANLPYIPTRELPRKPDSAGFEPRAALDGGRDGLRHYRRLLSIVPSILAEKSLLLMEAAPPTIEPLQALALAALPRASVEVRCDYAGLRRYVYALSA